MNPHSAIADSNGLAVVGPKTNANQAGSSSCEGAPTAESSPAQVAPRRDESDESDKWLTIEHVAPNPLQASAVAIRDAPSIRAAGEASAKSTVIGLRDPGHDPAKDVWPLTLDQIIKQALVRLLGETAGNRRRTASLLGISRSTLYRMLERYGIDKVGRIATSRKPGIGPKAPPVPPVPTD